MARPGRLVALLILSACNEASPPAPGPSGAPAASVASAAASVRAPGGPSATAAASASARSAASGSAPSAAKTECRVTQGGKLAFSGPCTFAQEGGNGSFSVEPVGSGTIAGARPLTVSILSPGVADVRGLTADGINSRWGEAKRSADDKACWTGADFEICAYAGAAPRAKGPSGDDPARKAVEQRHGERYWAVYVAEGMSDDAPAIAAAREALVARGLSVGVTLVYGSLGCDVGAAAALGRPDDANALAVYFAAEADARAFADTLEPKALGVVRIQAMCRD